MTRLIVCAVALCLVLGGIAYGQLAKAPEGNKAAADHPRGWHAQIEERLARIEKKLEQLAPVAEAKPAQRPRSRNEVILSSMYVKLRNVKEDIHQSAINLENPSDQATKEAIQPLYDALDQAIAAVREAHEKLVEQPEERQAN